MDQPSILIFDQNQRLCQSLQSLLEKWQIEFLVMASAGELQAILKDKRFDIFMWIAGEERDSPLSFKKELEAAGFLFWVQVGELKRETKNFDLLWPEKLCNEPQHLELLLDNVLQLAKRMKKQKEMASLVLHDLRTPLQNLNSYVELLNQNIFGELNVGQKKIIANILLQTDLAIELLQELSDILRSKRRTPVLARSKISFNRLLNDVVRSLWVLADRKNIKIQSVIPQNLPLVAVNPIAIKRVLFNLLLNAIKFSKQDGLIRISVKVMSKKRPQLLVQISDSGPGIPAEHLTKVFEIYYRLEQSPIRLKGGGLGLYIAKTLIEEHGGRIAAYNNREGGSTFYFTLPL